ncbi:MAG: rod shape-determining protein MreC [Burkholderiales bacterium]|nr:rod shape-determining protein MreC [Burkholderiales bacterium]
MTGQTANKKFFGPRPSSVTSFGFFAVVSVLLMITDHQMRMMEPIRSGLTLVSDSVYTVLAAPVRLARDVSAHMTSKDQLLKNNQELKDEIMKVQVLGSRLETLEEENRMLKQMLMQKKVQQVPSAVFQVTRVLSDGYTQRFQINGGSDQGLQPGMPVLSEKGLAGQLVHVGPFSSLLRLVQDKNQEVPVLFEGSGIRGLVRGTGEDLKLESRDLPYTDKIKPGDKVVTSGLDGVYPKGIPVGTVISALPSDTGSYVEVTIKAVKGMGNNDSVLVLLVDPINIPPPIEDEPELMGTPAPPAIKKKKAAK